MASLRQEAQDVLTEARDGIAWIAVWKDGRGWCSTTFWPDVLDDTPTLQFDDFELEMLGNVARLDPNAILVNSYYHNLGSTESMTRDSLAAALRWQYEIGHNTLADIIAAEK